MIGSLDLKLQDPVYRAEFERRQEFFRIEVQILLAMEDRDWGLSDLAKATGIHKQNVCRDLKNGGLHKASLDHIARYAEALDLRMHPILVSKKKEKKIMAQLHRLLSAA